MSNIYVEALYNENRNAIPSWQGYHYQGQVATFFFLKYILGCFNSECEYIQDISMKIEWMEDFIIFEKDIVKHIYQVKKTLNSKEYTDVIQNFILQQKIIGDDSCKWIVVYNKANKNDFETVIEENFNKIRKSYIIDCIVDEINQLIENKDNPEFWIDNLNLNNKKSKLQHIRHYIRKLMYNDRLERVSLTQQKCNKFVQSHLNILIEKLEEKADDFTKFKSQIEFCNKKIEKLEIETQNTVKDLITKGFMKKSDIMSHSDIVNYLYVQLYQKLMNVKNKKTESFVINFEDVKEIFLCSEKAKFLWKEEVCITREKMFKNIEEYCNKCSTKKCRECVVTQFRDLDFYKIIDNCNLEYPKFRAENISESLTNKLSADKYNHLINILFKHKQKIDCIKDTNYIELQNSNKNMFVSEYIADEDDPFGKNNLINNIPQHLDIYKEYNNIVTKCFSEVIDYEDIKIITDLEEKEKVQGGERKHPKFMDILPINFKSKKDIEEE
ncbi:TPA: hypothetical protein LA742_003240 [Clostridium botulinum]|nr:hypothetical protein [Clostridium botulinum]